MDNTIRDDMKELAEEMNRIYTESNVVNNEALIFVSKNINYPIEMITDILEDNSYWEHQGYVKVERSDYKSGFYPNYDFYNELGNKGYHYMRQDDEGEFHNLVWQTTGYCEDDYSGFLLFPLANGEYWKIRYSC